MSKKSRQGWLDGMSKPSLIEWNTDPLLCPQNWSMMGGSTQNQYDFGDPTDYPIRFFCRVLIETKTSALSLNQFLPSSVCTLYQSNSKSLCCFKYESKQLYRYWFLSFFFSQSGFGLFGTPRWKCWWWDLETAGRLLVLWSANEMRWDRRWYWWQRHTRKRPGSVHFFSE